MTGRVRRVASAVLSLPTHEARMRRSPLALVAALLVAASPALAAKPAARAPAGMLAPVTSVEGITEYRLPNGLRVVLFPDPSKPTVTVNVTYFVGSKHEGSGEAGMAHLLEHLLFKGTPKHPRIPQELTERGARPNGTTWLDRTNYFETLPSSEANLAWALSFEADRMVHSFIAQKDLDSEMTVVRNELERGENNPHAVLLRRVLGASFLFHPYGKPTIGNRADVENIPIERLQAFYRKYYRPDNAMLVVAGRFDEAKALQLIQGSFGKLPRPAQPLPRTYTEEPTQDGEREVTLRRVGETAALTAVYHIPEGAHPDFGAIDVLTEALGDTPSGRLYKALVETRKAVRASASNLQLQDPGMLVFNTQLREGQSVEAARAVLLQTVEEAARTPFTAEEVSRAKTSLLKSVELLLNNSEDAAIALSEWAAIGDWRLLFLHRDRVEAVKPEDVTRVAAAYLKPSNRSLGQFVPTPKPERAEMPPRVELAALLQGYQGRAAVTQGEAFDPSPTHIESRVLRPAPRGEFRLALLPKRTRGQMVEVALSLHWGTAEAVKGQVKVGEATGALLMRGTKTKSRQQIQDTLDQLKARVGVSGGPLGASISVETTRENLPAVLRLVAEVLREPAFDAQEFTLLQQQWLASLEKSRSEPETQGGSAYLRVLGGQYPEGHPYYVPTVDENIARVKAVTREQVVAFHRNFYGASNGEFAAVGDFEAPALEALVGELFGAWKSPAPYARVPQTFNDAAPRSVVVETPDKANAFLRAGHNVQLREDHPDWPALMLGNFMLGGGFLNSRLATRIRHQEGLSYTVSSALTASPFDEVGSFTAHAIYAPQNAARLENALREELGKVLEKGFTAEEVAKARSGLLEYRQSRRAQDDGLVWTLATYLFYGRTLDFDAALEQRLARLSPEEVRQALARHVDPKKLTVVKAGDFEGTQQKAPAKVPASAAP
ncbi:pitrilysin family protein [Stigmatella sp. ncwal1]|uniref:Pitrilysin family protein n=1 Tax=Stigmatella ashevillensis TaxID=2995309 RepID=A0ABT5DDV3_9BACT|nr:pitrilysin family protein [Stigmatella ashevillena]MDC0711803.1 pitrilysin family protein [Stigmatella ashevillena]